MRRSQSIPILFLTILNSNLLSFYQTIELNPSFSKGYGRKGGALHGARKFEEAIEAYDKGLELAPADAALQKGKQEVQRAMGELMRWASLVWGE